MDRSTLNETSQFGDDAALYNSLGSGRVPVLVQSSVSRRGGLCRFWPAWIDLAVSLRVMSLLYRAMYAVGFAPWDTGEISGELEAVIEGPGALATGRALDIGCGTGAQATYLAQHGWQVTGIDVASKPLKKARQRARAAGVQVELLRADITQATPLPHAGEYVLVHDRGCFHGLRGAQRAAYVRAVTTLTQPDGLLVLMSFARNRVPGGPAGADPDEIARLFGSWWRIEASTPDTDSAPAGPMHDVPRYWHRLIRDWPNGPGATDKAGPTSHPGTSEGA